MLAHLPPALITDATEPETGVSRRVLVTDSENPRSGSHGLFPTNPLSGDYLFCKPIKSSPRKPIGIQDDLDSSPLSTHPKPRSPQVLRAQ